MYRILTIFTLFLLSCTLQAQDPQLAQQYFQNGEYEKASSLFKILYEKSNGNDYYFNKYIESLIYLESYDESEAIIKKQIKAQPDNVQLYVTYGNLYEKQLRDDDANAQYDRAIQKIGDDRFKITKLANAFTNLQKYDLALKTYEKGAKEMKDKHLFAYNMGDLYRRKGDVPNKMIDSYLNSLKNLPSRLNSMKTLFQRYLAPDDYLELQAQLYARIQEDTDATYYNELLIWSFIQNKDYTNAFRQVKALDRQLDENGGRIFRLAEIAKNGKDYDAAIEAYDYLVNEKGSTSSFYMEAKSEALSVRRQKLVEGFDYEKTDLLELEKQYNEFLDENGRNKNSAVMITELADLEAFYLNDLDKAIKLLDELINYPGVKRPIEARAKLSLADFYLMKGEVWESTLLYSQVDKEYKDDLLGHEARFKNAKLSYYTSEFQWAQTQFDVLKASTSKLIANDALDLSIFIMDNLGLDTTVQALRYYADADLLVFQNRFEDAFVKLDSLNQLFPEHALEDDIFYVKAKVYIKKRDYPKAITMLDEIITNHLDGIRGDNALFMLAELYENQLNDPEKAKSLYEKLFIDLSGSTLAVEARKRFRRLRGDGVQ